MKAPSAERTLVNIAAACRLADVSRRTLYNWMHTGKVEYIRTAGGARRVYVDTLFRGLTPAVLREHPDPIALPPFPKGPLIPPSYNLLGRDKFRMAKMEPDDFLKALLRSTV